MIFTHSAATGDIFILSSEVAKPCQLGPKHVLLERKKSIIILGTRLESSLSMSMLQSQLLVSWEYEALALLSCSTVKNIV